VSGSTGPPTGAPPTDSHLPRGVAMADPPALVVHFDGACRSVGGRRIAAYGWTVEGAGLSHEGNGLAVPPGHVRATNNVAEYAGAICALEWLLQRSYRGRVLVRGDSELVVRQMNGEYEVRAEHLRPYHDRLRQLATFFERTEFAWVPREENERADALSKEGILAAVRGPGRAGRGPVRGAGDDRGSD